MSSKLFTPERIRKLEKRESEMKAGKAVTVKHSANLDKEMSKPSKKSVRNSSAA